MPDDLEALREDALRYRWLREQHWSSSPLCVVSDPRRVVKLGAECPSQGNLDTLVDKFRKEAE